MPPHRQTDNSIGRKPQTNQSTTYVGGCKEYKRLYKDLCTHEQTYILKRRQAQLDAMPQHMKLELE